MDSVAKILTVISASLCCMGTEAGNGHAKRLALLGIFNARGKNAFGCAHHSRAKFEPPNIENVEGDHVSAANFTEHVLHRHFYVVKINGRGGAALDAHFVL